MSTNREAETDEEEDADGSDLVDEILSVYISSRAHSVRSAALQCIRRLLLPGVAGSTPILLFERDRGNDQHIQNARLPTADVVLNRVATIAASADVWGLKMWSLRHAPSSNPVKNFWCMHEWIAELCCFSLKVHFNHGDAEPCKRDDRDTQDTYWTDTVDVFDNVAFLLMMSPSCEARKGAHVY